MTLGATTSALSAMRPAADLVTDLLRPEAYPAPHPDHVELRETHVSRVFMTEGEVFKVKKPVRFAFLDFSTLDARRRACEAEVLLNSRLAAGTYLGLVPVRRDAARPASLRPRRARSSTGPCTCCGCPTSSARDERLAPGRSPREHIDAVASSLADFHARARCDAATSEWGTRRRHRRATFARTSTRSTPRERACSRRRRRARSSAGSSISCAIARASSSGARESGRIREGHGDLRLDHLYLDDAGRAHHHRLHRVQRPVSLRGRVRRHRVPLDGPRCARPRRPRRAIPRSLCARRRRLRPLCPVDFYEGYRAYVRGKVSALTARQATGALRDHALADARRHFALALSAGRRSLLDPVVVAVGGVIASGKSTIADALGRSPVRAGHRRGSDAQAPRRPGADDARHVGRVRGAVRPGDDRPRLRRDDAARVDGARVGPPGRARRLVPHRGAAPSGARPRGGARRSVPDGRVSRAPGGLPRAARAARARDERVGRATRDLRRVLRARRAGRGSSRRRSSSCSIPSAPSSSRWPSSTSASVPGRRAHVMTLVARLASDPAPRSARGGRDAHLRPSRLLQAPALVGAGRRVLRVRPLRCRHGRSRRRRSTARSPCARSSPPTTRRARASRSARSSVAAPWCSRSRRRSAARFACCATRIVARSRSSTRRNVLVGAGSRGGLHGAHGPGAAWAR